MDENKPTETKQAVPILPCGHEASFEHELVTHLLNIFEQAPALGIDPLEASMDYVKQIFAYFYMQVPTYDGMMKIALSHRQEGGNS